jgi:hypothetical protein
MVFLTPACECELTPRRGSANCSGIGKTSTGAVRNVLRHELDGFAVGSSGNQAARSGPVTSSVIRLYRAGLA